MEFFKHNSVASAANELMEVVLERQGEIAREMTMIAEVMKLIKNNEHVATAEEVTHLMERADNLHNISQFYASLLKPINNELMKDCPDELKELFELLSCIC